MPKHRNGVHLTRADRLRTLGAAIGRTKLMVAEAERTNHTREAAKLAWLVVVLEEAAYQVGRGADVVIQTAFFPR